MTPKEEVLYSAAHVMYKMNEGTIYIMPEKLVWIHENRDTSVCHSYLDIKSQKISPAGKEKVLLQIALHDATASTFQFVHPEGLSVQIGCRNEIMEHLLLLLPKFFFLKRKLSLEKKEKKPFAKKPRLKQLQLVSFVLL